MQETTDRDGEIDVWGILRFSLGRLYAATEISSIYFSSFIPSNWVRIQVLRAWRAKIGKNSAVHHGL